MQVRFSTCIGMEVLEEGTGSVLAQVTGIFIHPDTGKIEGMFVRQGGFSQGDVFITANDILSLGTCLYVRDENVLCNPDDILRLQPLFQDVRTVLGQRMRTESGRRLGRCADVQFDTRSMKIQWLFPKKFWRWGAPVAVKDVVEIRPDAIILRDLERAEPVESEEEKTPFAAPSFPEIPEPGVTMK